MDKRKAPVPLSCAICGRRLLPGEVFVMLVADAVAMTMCRPSTSLACLGALLEAVPDPSVPAWRFLDPAAARQLDDAETNALDDGRWRN